MQAVPGMFLKILGTKKTRELIETILFSRATPEREEIGEKFLHEDARKALSNFGLLSS